MPEKRPNILLITTDRQRFDALHMAGNPVIQTPNLDHWGTSGVSFSRAYSTTPSCIPARRTLLTGQHAATHGMPWYEDCVPFNPRFTMPQLLGQSGYQTQLIGKFHMYPAGVRHGFDHIILSDQLDFRPESPHFGRNDYARWVRSQGPWSHEWANDPGAAGLSSNGRMARPFQLPEALHHTNWCVQQALDFVLERRDPTCPWFLHLSFWAPHPPLVPPAAYFDRYNGRSDLEATIGDWAPKPDAPPVGVRSDDRVGPYDPAEIRTGIAGYYATVNHIDDQLGLLMSRLSDAGTRRSEEPLVVIFTSDHGEMLGDHQLWGLALPYEASTRIPMLVTARNFDLEPSDRDEMVCWEDLAPTILDLAGVEHPSPMDGRSLLPALQGRGSAGHEVIYGEHGRGTAPAHFVIRGTDKYIWFDSGEEQMFDLAGDPLEQHDLSGDEEAMEPFRALLEARLQGRKDYTFDRSALRPLRNRQPSFFGRRRATS